MASLGTQFLVAGTFGGLLGLTETSLEANDHDIFVATFGPVWWP